MIAIIVELTKSPNEVVVRGQGPDGLFYPMPKVVTMPDDALEAAQVLGDALRDMVVSAHAKLTAAFNPSGVVRAVAAPPRLVS